MLGGKTTRIGTTRASSELHTVPFKITPMSNTNDCFESCYIFFLLTMFTVIRAVTILVISAQWIIHIHNIHILQTILKIE